MKPVIKRLALFFLSFIVFHACAFNVCAGDSVKFVSKDRLLKMSVPDSLSKNEEVYLFLEDILKIDKSSAEHIVHFAKKVLKAEKGVAYPFIFTESNVNKIKSIRARVITPEGKVTEVKKKEINTISDFASYSFFNDYKKKIISFSGIEDDYIIEIIVKREIKSSFALPFMVFQDTQPILSRRVSIEYPSDVKIKISAVRMSSKPDETLSLKNGNNLLVWRRDNIPALKPESSMPPVEEFIPAICPVTSIESGADFTSWSGISEWYRGIIEKSMDTSSEEIKNLAMGLIDGAGGDEEKIKRIYDWVKRNVWYLTITLGDHGIVPHNASLCLKNRYGDCKDKSVLLVSLLRACGIDASPVLVRTTDIGVFDPPVVSPAYFNHVIVAVFTEGDGDTTFLDPVCSSCPYGVLPEDDQRAHALIIRENSKRLITLPINKMENNEARIKISIRIDSTGNANVDSDISLAGSYCTELTGVYKNRSGLSVEDITRFLFTADPFGIRKDAIKIECPDLTREELRRIKLSYSIPGMLDTDKRIVFMDAVPFNISFNLPPGEKRNYPVELGKPQRRVIEVDLIVPKGWRFVELPKDEVIDGGSFRYSLKFHPVSERECRVESVYEVLKRDIPPLDWLEARERLIEIIRKEKTKIAVEKVS